MHNAASLPRSTPEAQGIASTAITAFIEEADQRLDSLHSFMLVRHGNVVAEGWWSPYGPDLPHVLFSLSKSFTSTAAGLAIAEGAFALEDTVISFFPEALPETVSENLSKMTVRDLLAMATGHAEDTTGYLHRSTDGDWVRAFLACPVEHEPGTYFLYNSGATYMVSAIVQKVTGQTVLDFLTPRLLTPLGIFGAAWDNDPRGINVGGWGLNIRTEDIAKFGQLYLQNGQWYGEQLVPVDWIAEATRKQIENRRTPDEPDHDWNQGYGYQFWRCRHDAYRGDGAFGQYCIVLPEFDAVVAITSGIGNMGSVLDLVWTRLLPAFENAPLPTNPTTHAILEARLRSLVLHPPTGNVTSPTAERVSGRHYRITPTDDSPDSLTGLTLTFGTEDTTLHLRNGCGEFVLGVGLNGNWLRGETRFWAPAHDRDTPRPIACSGVWETENTFVIKAAYYCTPFVGTLRVTFQDNNEAEIQSRINVGFGPTEPVTVRGIAENP